MTQATTYTATCVWCDTLIEQPNRDIGLMYWAHPDLYDVDCDGTMCPEDEDHPDYEDHVAEPDLQ